MASPASATRPAYRWRTHHCVKVSASVEATEERKLRLAAEAVGEDGERVALGRGTFVRAARS